MRFRRRGDEQALQDVLIEAYYVSIPLILLNLIWFVLTLPVVTALPALGGLFYATNRLAHQQGADWRVFWKGFRKCFWLSWCWGLVNILVLGVLGANLWFYARADAPLLAGLRGAAFALILLWGLLQLFTFPLLLEQDDRRMVTAVRNSLVILIRCPLPALGTALVITAVIVPSVYVFPPAWIVISASLCAYLANRTVIDAIKKIARP